MYSNITLFIYELIHAGIKIWVKDSEIKLFVPEKASFSDQQKAFIKNNKNSIISCLESNNVYSKDYEILILDNKLSQPILSFGQERLWFIERYTGGTNAYNIPMVFKLSINTKLDILEKSIKSIVSRHEILRTLIKEDNEGNSYQLVLDNEEAFLEIFTIHKVKDKSTLDKILGQEINHIYDLSKECPIRVRLYKLFNCNNKGLNKSTKINNEQNITECYLSILVHHIAFDDWSSVIFLKELQAYYCYYYKNSIGIKTEINLPKLSIQYKDFALWQKSYISGDRLNQQINYWKSKLKDHQTLHLNTETYNPNEINYIGQNSYFELSSELSIALRKLAQELEVSLHSLLLSGYYLMLRAYSNQDDIVVGMPVANRHYSLIKDSIGFFVNSLALRIKINPEASIKEFIQYVGDEVVAAQLNQDLPFEKIVEELKIEREKNKNPIFQVMFAVQSFNKELPRTSLLKSDDNSNLAYLMSTYEEATEMHNVAPFHISTFINDSDTKLKGVFNYTTSLYTKEIVNRFINTYKKVLKKLVSMYRYKKIKLRYLVSNI